MLHDPVNGRNPPMGWALGPILKGQAHWGYIWAPIVVPKHGKHCKHVYSWQAYELCVSFRAVFLGIQITIQIFTLEACPKF